MGTRIQVRATEIGDASALVGLFDVLGYPATESTIGERLARLRDDDAYESWVATDDGLVVRLADRPHL